MYKRQGKKEKKFFYFRSRRVDKRRIDKESYLNLELGVKNYSRFAAIKKQGSAAEGKAN